MVSAQLRNVTIATFRQLRSSSGDLPERGRTRFIHKCIPRIGDGEEWLQETGLQGQQRQAGFQKEREEEGGGGKEVLKERREIRWEVEVRQEKREVGRGRKAYSLGGE